VDSCGETLNITLEKMNFVVSLFDYPMGTKSTAQLFGILRLEYVVSMLYHFDGQLGFSERIICVIIFFAFVLGLWWMICICLEKS
jgi:hypothetical protein